MVSLGDIRQSDGKLASQIFELQMESLFLFLIFSRWIFENPGLIPNASSNAQWQFEGISRVILETHLQSLPLQPQHLFWISQDMLKI